MTTTAEPAFEAWSEGAPPHAGGSIAGKTPLQLFWERFREDKVALAALGFIVLEIALAILAPWIVKLLGHPPNAQYPERLDPTYGTPTGPSRDSGAGSHPMRSSCTTRRRRPVTPPSPRATRSGCSATARASW